MLPGDRLVCAFIEPVTIGLRFKQWLLHITIVPWFQLDDASEQLATGLAKPLASIEPFHAAVGIEAAFGPNKDRPAHLLEPNRFVTVEHKVRNYLHKKRAWLVDETTKTKRSYTPHVTFQKDEHLKTGDQIFCDSVYIIEQKGDYKAVVAEVKLGEKAA